MSCFQPLFVPGASYFFTVRLRDPRSKLLIKQIDLLRLAVRVCRQKAPFRIGPTVVLPNRLHMVWTLPPDDVDYRRRWKMIKTTFVHHLPKQRGYKAPIWQRRYWECPIDTVEDYALYEALIRDAPLDEKLVKRAGDWPYSSLSQGMIHPMDDAALA